MIYIKSTIPEPSPPHLHLCTEYAPPAAKEVDHTPPLPATPTNREGRERGTDTGRSLCVLKAIWALVLSEPPLIQSKSGLTEEDIYTYICGKTLISWDHLDRDQKEAIDEGFQ